MLGMVFAFSVILIGSLDFMKNSNIQIFLSDLYIEIKMGKEQTNYEWDKIDDFKETRLFIDLLKDGQATIRIHAYFFVNREERNKFRDFCKRNIHLHQQTVTS